MEISKPETARFFLCVTVLMRVSSLPTGAPPRACSDMLPRHSGTRPQAADTSPFSLSQPTSYFPGQASSISVVSNNPTRTIRGLMLQARRVGDGAPNGVDAIVGTWTLLNGENDGYRLTECSHPGDTVTHRHRNNDTDVLFLWQAPEDLSGGVQFTVTVVESYTSYWPRLTSSQVVFPAAGPPTEVLPCDSSPCQNEGTCSNNGQIFTCACLDGYEGLLCESEAPQITPCDSQPCLNGGTCFNLGLEEDSPFACVCPDGYGGLTCQTVPAPCNSLPCQNGGTCSGNGQSFICFCRAEFEGLLCESEVPSIAPCDSQPCLNGGTCFNLGTDEQSPFFCICADGYTGMTCQTVTDPCLSNPCANDGFCFSSEGGSMFACLCFGDFSGPTCETVSPETNPCVESACQNGGTCVINDDLITTRCMCPSGYDGPSCETAVCPDGYCQNTATCRVLNGLNTCFCGTGFTGIRCETRISPCISNPCYEGGTCNDGSNGEFQCACPEGRQGARCETVTAICPNDYCSNGGSCFVTTETRGDAGERFECVCAQGFTGERCQSGIDECASTPCQNNGYCVDGVNEFYCDCQSGFGGPFCEHCYNLCLPECEEHLQCENHGTCVYSESYGDVFCDCLPGYMGSRCEVDFDECASVPCQNNGHCVDGVDEFYCDCPIGFGGPFCEHCYNLCLPECEAHLQCEHHGTCVYSGEQYGEVFCDCLPGYVGDRCEIDRDECESNPCSDGAVCIDHVDGYQCTCVHSAKPGCENTAEPVEACTDPDRCPAGSECIDLFSGFFCICPDELKDDSLCGKFMEVKMDKTIQMRPSGVNKPFRYG